LEKENCLLSISIIEKFRSADADLVKTAILLNMRPEVKTLMNVIGFQTFYYKRRCIRDQTVCIRVKELGNALIILINNIVDIKKLDAIMALRISLSTNPYFF
jgi:hypothetical protein